MTLKWIAWSVLFFGVVSTTSAQPFTQCPAAPKTNFENFTFSGCVSLIIANADGSFTIKEDSSQPTNDAGHAEQDDALIGFQNNSGSPVSAIRRNEKCLYVRLYGKLRF